MEKKTRRALVSIFVNFSLVLLAVIVMYNLGMWGFNLGAEIFNEQPVDSEQNARVVEITIPVNITDDKLVDLLYEKGLIEDKLVFKVQELLSDYKGKAVAGTYTLDTSMKPTEIMQTICASQNIDIKTNKDVK